MYVDKNTTLPPNTYLKGQTMNEDRHTDVLEDMGKMGQKDLNCCFLYCNYAKGQQNVQHYQTTCIKKKPKKP